MAPDPDRSPDSNRPPTAPTLYRHSKRPEWGLAILAWERGTLRAFQFEDGKLRVFKQGYYELMHEVGREAERAAETAAELERKLGASASSTQSTAGPADEEPSVSFADQVRIFTIEYPDGFQDREWTRGKRGEDTRRRLKRHRDHAILEAQRSLAEARTTVLVDEERYEELVADAVAILDATDLVTRKQLQQISSISPPMRRGLAIALSELLHGNGPYPLRFERFVAALSRGRRGPPSWQLATALPALVAPDAHVCVRPASMRKQALQMFSDFVYANTPSAPLYIRFLDLANKVRDALGAAGLAPRDLLDVHDFIAETQRPSARRLLEH